MKVFNTIIFNFIQEHSLLAEGNRVLVACSAGVDSVALLHFLALNREKLKVEVAAVHVDHMLRGSESAADGELVSDLCEVLGIPFFGGSVPVPEILKKEGGNVQAICREGRYSFFTEIMREHQYDVLAIGHHAEDQLETVLMQVTKGLSPLGIPVKRKLDGGILIRPFLPTVKESLYSYASKNKLLFNEDPSNESLVYMRNRFRKNIVPHILHENVTAAEKVVVLANNLQKDEAYLQLLAKEKVEELVEFTVDGFPSVNRGTFSDMPTALQRRMIPLLLGYLYDRGNAPVHYKSELIGQILHHLDSEDGNVSLNLPLGYQFIREYNKLTFSKDSAIQDELMSKNVLQGIRTNWINGLWIYWESVEAVDQNLLRHSKESMYFDLPNDSLPLIVRARQDGDRMLFPGMTQPKRLSRLFIDEKVKKIERDRLPIITTKQGEICAVPGIRYGVEFTKSRKTSSKYIFLVGELIS